MAKHQAIITSIRIPAATPAATERAGYSRVVFRFQRRSPTTGRCPKDSLYSCLENREEDKGKCEKERIEKNQ